MKDERFERLQLARRLKVEESRDRRVSYLSVAQWLPTNNHHRTTTTNTGVDDHDSESTTEEPSSFPPVSVGHRNEFSDQ